MNADVLSIILKFVNYKTLLNFKLVCKKCKYLVDLELQYRLKLNPQKNTILPLDYISISLVSKYIEKSMHVDEILRLLSILYISCNRTFKKLNACIYKVPLNILHFASNDEFETCINHWVIYEYLNEIPGLLSREELSVVKPNQKRIADISKRVENEIHIDEMLKLLSILYIFHEKTFENMNWYQYNLPMKILHLASNDDEFEIYLNHWMIQEYLNGIPGLWSREEILMAWYDKMSKYRQELLKRHLLKIYGYTGQNIEITWGIFEFI